jgi:hypothetical protein
MAVGMDLLNQFKAAELDFLGLVDVFHDNCSWFMFFFAITSHAFSRSAVLLLGFPLQVSYDCLASLVDPLGDVFNGTSLQFIEQVL